MNCSHANTTGSAQSTNTMTGCPRCASARASAFASWLAQKPHTKDVLALASSYNGTRIRFDVHSIDDETMASAIREMQDLRKWLAKRPA